MNWIGAEFEKFTAWAKGLFSSHDSRLAELEAKVAKLEHDAIAAVERVV